MKIGQVNRVGLGFIVRAVFLGMGLGIFSPLSFAQSSVYFPGNMGDYWVYERMGAGSSNASVYTNKVLSSSHHQGGAWLHMNNYLSQERLFLCQANGTVLELMEQGFDTHYHFDVNKWSWDAPVPPDMGSSSDDEMECFFGGHGITVDTPAGIFEDCYRIDMELEDEENAEVSLFFAPHVGLVKSIFRVDGDVYADVLLEAQVGPQSYPEQGASEPDVYLTADRNNFFLPDHGQSFTYGVHTLNRIDLSGDLVINQLDVSLSTQLSASPWRLARINIYRYSWLTGYQLNTSRYAFLGFEVVDDIAIASYSLPMYFFEAYFPYLQDSGSFGEFLLEIQVYGINGHSVPNLPMYVLPHL